MLIPASKCGLVIGRGGETIRQINKESGAYCEMSRDPSISAIEKQFVIRGSETQVEHAKHLIRVKVGDIPPNTPYINTRAAQPLQFSHQNPTAIDSWRGKHHYLKKILLRFFFSIFSATIHHTTSEFIITSTASSTSIPKSYGLFSSTRLSISSSTT